MNKFALRATLIFFLIFATSLEDRLIKSKNYEFIEVILWKRKQTQQNKRKGKTKNASARKLCKSYAKSCKSYLNVIKCFDKVF